MPRLEQELMIANELGLHARASAKLVQIAARYRSEVTVQAGDEAVDAKSILGVLTLAAVKGTPITIITEGDDAEACLAEIALLVNDKFGEGK